MKFFEEDILYDKLLSFLLVIPRIFEAQNNGGFFNKVKNALSADTEIGSYTFKRWLCL